MQHSSSLTNSRQWGRTAPPSFARSPLYQYLHARIGQDQEITALRELISSDQPFHVLFFTVINYLLLRESEEGHRHPFAEYHPYFTPVPQPVEQAYPAFRDFVLLHANELVTLLPQVRLQTNEVTRCANLLPAFELVCARGKRCPLVLVEVGASAGFNLFWDRYGYQYHLPDQTCCSFGDPCSPVQIQCQLQGVSLPPLPASFPVVLSRVGVDLLPRMCQQPEDARWLRACIWPEERWRYEVLDAALSVAQQDPPPVLAGDAADLLDGILTDLDRRQPEATVCLYHSFALLQSPASSRERLLDLLAAHSRTRDLYRVSLEWDQPNHWPTPRLELFTYRAGKQTEQEWLANCDVHGKTLYWL